MKKKIGLLITLFFVSVVTLHGQDCKLCGDWSGIYTPTSPGGDFNVHTVKYIVRIKKTGDNYLLRIKLHPVDNKKDVTYWNDCMIVDATDNSIEFKMFAFDTYKGASGFDKTYVVGTLVYRNGTLSLSYHFYDECYDRQGNFVGSSNKMRMDTELLLYKDDDDW